MEYLLIIVVTVVIALLDDRIRGRKKVPPPTAPQDIPRPKKRKAQRGTFEIPPMRGISGTAEASVDAEVLREQELRAKWEEARRAAEREKRVRQREERAAQEQQTVPAAPYTPVHHTAALLPRLTPDAMKQAIVLAEVLGRPRALRRFPRR